MKSTVRIFICLWFLGVLLGCATLVTVESSDKSATIYKSDQEDDTKGNITFRDARPAWATTNITIEKDGCQKSQYTLRKTDEFHSEAFLASLFITPYAGPVGLLPLLWITTFEKKYILNYLCEPRGEK